LEHRLSAAVTVKRTPCTPSLVREEELICP
jgi:hypothetical protein